MLGRACAVATATVTAWGAAAWGAEYRYVEPGSRHEYAVLTAPLPADEIGVATVAALRTARELHDGVSGLVDEHDSLPQPAPPLRERVGEIRWSPAAPAPFGAAKGGAKACGCSTAIGDLERERVAALYLKRTFHVGPERAQVKVLRLRARYHDGLVAYVNGVEVARRAIDAGARPTAPARRPHGPEWETFHIAVSPELLVDGDNTLLIEVRPHLLRLAPLIDLELVGTEQARIVRGPIVQRVGETRATIVFETDLPTRAEVEVGRSASRYDRKIASAGGEPTARHVVELDGLEAGEKVHYRIVTSAEQTGDYAFHAAPSADEPLRFVVYGDVRSGHETHADLLARIVEEAPDFLIATGDMVLRGTDEADWQRFFSIAGPVLPRFPMYPAIGNHDLGQSGDSQRRFEDIFALWPAPPGRPEGAAWYSFDVAGVHWVMLDSNRYDDARQLEWLAKDLEGAAGARAIFVATHHGPWSRGPHGGEKTCVDKYAPLMERHGVAVVFSGHDHLYQRGQVGRLRYVVSGGGGAPLYKVSCGKGRQRPCAEDGVAIVASEHHYVAVELFGDHARLCPKRKDGTPIEECVDVALASRR